MTTFVFAKVRTGTAIAYWAFARRSDGEKEMVRNADHCQSRQAAPVQVPIHVEGFRDVRACGPGLLLKHCHSYTYHSEGGNGSRSGSPARRKPSTESRKQE